MFAKLATLILGLGIVACVLLTVRQQRIQASHELAATQRRVGALDRDLWRLRLEISSRLAPGSIERTLAGLGPRHHIPLAWPTPISERDLAGYFPIVPPAGVLAHRDQE